MNEQQQRIAIAEWMGWTDIGERIKCASGKQLLGSKSYLGGIPPNPSLDIDWEIYSEPIPDYPDDLNAMHEAEKKLYGDQRWSYTLKLSNLCQYAFGQSIFSSTTFATSQQRSEALCRTLWPERFSQ